LRHEHPEILSDSEDIDLTKIVLNGNGNEAKVLGLFPYFGPEAVGGVQASARIAWDAITEHAQLSPTLLVYANDAHSRVSRNGSETVVVNSKRKAIYKALSRNWSHDLVFVWHLGLLRLLPFFRLSKVRVVIMLLGIEAWKQQRGLTRRQLEKVDLFLSISEHTWHSFVELNRQYESKPHQTILLGIGDPLIGETPAPSATPAALMLSRLSSAEDYKGHREVISAWPRVLQRNPQAELWIVGDGDLRGDLQRLTAELKLEQQVRFFGYVSDEVKERLLAECRCMVMPSRAEGFGLVYLEAMRVGRPCLVSTLDAGREVVNPPEAGLAANPDDEAELAGSICRLLDDGPEWRQWSAQARRRYEENYTAQHFQQRLLAALFPGPGQTP
jgi:glycosyltransferase involved in cell wall biosynthesis